jgi:tRNA threonylcarbamoyl adenosine modification protein YeaZ
LSAAAARPVLALETSTRTPSVALQLPGEPPREVELGAERAHASDLLPCVAHLLDSAGLEVRGLGALVLGLGPGSFTGLRVGAAVVLGLERALGLPCVGVDSFAVALAPVLGPGEAGLLWREARGGRLYCAGHIRAPASQGGSADGVVPLRPWIPPFAPRRADCARELRPWLAHPAPDGVPWRWFAEPELFEFLAQQDFPGAARRDGAPILLEPAPAPRANALLALGLAALERGERAAPGSLRPLYLAAYGG